MCGCGESPKVKVKPPLFLLPRPLSVIAVIVGLLGVDLSILTFLTSWTRFAQLQPRTHALHSTILSQPAKDTLSYGNHKCLNYD
jgi:hypothetical protein